MFRNPAGWLLLLLLGLNVRAMAQATTGCFPIWQGFSHAWGYNHRINALGDWVKCDDVADSCIIWSHHRAASGSGADIASFTQHYSIVQSPLLQSQEAAATLSFRGREGDLLTESAIVEVEIPSLGHADDHVQALLNGFDLVTAEGAKADKLQQLDLAIDSVWRSDDAHKIKVKVVGQLRFSCSTGECEPLNQVVEYDLQAHVLVIVGAGFRSTLATFGSGRSWEKHDTAAALPMARVAILGESRYPEATVGIRGIHVQLNHEHHLMSWESRVGTASYHDGLFMAELGVTVRQNQAEMWDAYRSRYEGHPKLPAKWVVKAKEGSLVWEMDLALLQFEEANISTSSRSGQVECKTRHGAQIPAASKETENAVRVIH